MIQASRLPVILALAAICTVGIVAIGTRRIPQAPKQTMDLGISPGARILDVDDDTLRNDIERSAALGVREIRLDFDWSRIEASKGEPDWSDTDRIVEAAASADMTIHGLLTYTPRWARPAASSDKHPPTDPADFADFAAAAVARYEETGITSWEIWNEPNSRSFWSAPGGPDPEAFAVLVSAASVAIRAVDPDALVVSGGLAPAIDEAGVELSPETFLRTFLAEITPGTVDVVAIHPYSYPARPQDSSKSWNLFGRLPDIRDLVTEQSGAPLPIWITEFGAPTGSSSRAVSEQQQERIITDAVLCVNQTEWLEKIFLYNLRDRMGGDADDVEDNFGLFRADGQPKRSAEAVIGLQALEVGAPVDSPCVDW